MKLRINRSWLILATALAVGGLAAFGVNRYIKRQVADIEARSKAGRTVRVVVPKSDLARGTPIASSMVAVREVPAEWAHSNAVTPEQFDKVEGQKLAYPAGGGEMLMWSQFEGQRAPSFSSRLPTGRRAITVPVDEINSISGMVEPGDRIDMVVSVRKDQRTVLFPLLQNVQVLATGTRASPEAGPDGKQPVTYTTITLDASPDDAQRVLAAREIGKLAAVLRAPGDEGRTSSARRDAHALLGVDEAPARALGSTVPVLYGGRGGTLTVEPLRPPGMSRAEVVEEAAIRSAAPPAAERPAVAASAAPGPNTNRTTTDSRRR